ncbi:MAG: PAS domain S-box protein [Syntrophaceae bacterium]
MNPSKTNQELLEEISTLKQRIKQLEQLDSKRKLSEKALLESEERYRSLVDNIDFGINLIDKNFKIITTNVVTGRQFNKPASELSGKYCFKEFEKRQTVCEHCPGTIAMATGKAHQVDTEGIRDDGSSFLARIHAFPLFYPDGTVKGFNEVIEDITDLKRAEGALKASEEKYRKIFEGATEGIFQTTIEGRYLSMNPAFAKMFGFASPREMIDYGTNIGQQLYVYPKDREEMVRMLREHNKLDGYEVELYRKDRSKFWVSINIHTVRDASGNILYLEGTNVDITARENAEEALRESQEYTKILFNSSIIPQIVMDAETGVYIDCNEAAVKVYGYAGREEVLNKTPFDVSAPTQYNGLDSATEAQKRIQLCRKNSSHVFEWRHQRPNGQIWDAEVQLMLFQHRDKSLMQFTLRDITARKKAEEALRRSEATLRSVFKTTPVGLCIMKNRVFQSANKAWCEICGYSESDVIGHTPRLLFEEEEEYERVGRELYTSLSECGLASVQTKHRRKNGEIRDVILTAAPLHLDDISLGMALVTIEDITERKRAEEELRKSRRQLASIIDFLPDATLVIDKEGKVIAWNQAIENMTGVKKEDMLGKGNYECTLPFYGIRRPALIDLALHPNREMEKQYTAIQRMGDVLFGETFTPNLPSGSVHVSATASVLRDDKGEITAAIECIRDNTERKKLEDRLHRAEKMESLGTLAGGVAHDLNNVLGVLVGYSELLADELPVDSLQSKYAYNILKSSIKGTAIIQDLLTLARRGVAVSEVADLNRLVSDYLKTLEFEKLKSDHPDVIISIELEDGLLNIKGSPVHLGKTIMNLVSNAAEAISGRGEVALRTENRYLDHPIRGYDIMQEGDYALLIVSDTGIGIPANDLGKIFEPFYTKKVMGRSGTGLGLAVVWGTVKDHNGYIDVQSEEGKGTTFTLYFPVTREEIGEVEKAVSPVIYKGKGESILVVDDVKEQRELAINMLERLEYRVAAVAGGEEAIEYLKNKKADLIVLDMIMDPGIDGMETYRRIVEINPKQKAIIVSGFSETDRIRNAQEMGAGDFVRKPYVLEKIGLAVRKELDRKQTK